MYGQKPRQDYHCHGFKVINLQLKKTLSITPMYVIQWVNKVPRQLNNEKIYNTVYKIEHNFTDTLKVYPTQD